MSKTNIFVDTNTILHFTPLENIDWSAVVPKASDVTFVFALVVINEVDKHKRNPKFRNRASSFLKKVEEANKTRKIGNLKVEIIKSRVTERTLQEYDLTRTENDDLLIGYMLEHIKTEPGANVKLLTDDTSLKLRASIYGIECIELPSKYELKEEDERSKEIKKLTSQLQKLQSAIPKLNLQFDDGKLNIDIELIEPNFFGYKKSTLNGLHDKYYHLHVRLGVGHWKARFGIEDLSELDLNIYNTRLKQFYNDMETFFADYHRVFVEEGLTVQLPLKIVNNGTAPAINSEIELIFPDNVLVRVEPKFQKPSTPSPPSIFSVSQQYHPHVMLNRASIKTKDSGPAVVEKVGNRWVAKIKIDSIKHNQDFQFDGIHFTFNDFESASSFSIVCKIYADNVPEVIEQKLNIKLSKLPIK